MNVLCCDTAAVQAERLGKVYRSFSRPYQRLIQTLVRERHRFYTEFRALEDFSFCVRSGEVLGILGRNGSGKSTLLQILAGTLTPTTGSYHVRGRLAALLELGAGFNPEFTGRENVFLNAGILGLSRTETLERLDDIFAFADIGDFVDQPVKSYSSGMFVRLAFAVATAVDPDVLIIDEALAVGDVQFQSKCFRRFDELVSAGKTILLVTHSTEHVVRHCTRALLIDRGRLVAEGGPREVANEYIDRVLGGSSSSARAVGHTEFEPSEEGADSVCLNAGHARLEDRPGYCRSEYRWGAGGGAVLDLELATCDGAGHMVHFRSGVEVAITIRVGFDAPCEAPIIGFFVKTPDGVTVYGSNTLNTGVIIDPVPSVPAPELQVRFECTLNLGPGPYLVSAGLAVRRNGEIVPLDRRYDCMQFEVFDDSGAVGLANLHARGKLLEVS